MLVAPARAALLGALFAAVVTLPGLGTGTLWDNSETAYGEVAREILLTRDWVVMHLNGQPWFVQPPLYFWVAAIFAKVFGVGAFAMRLPAALATIAMGGAVGFATARIAGVRAGTIASIVLSTSLMQAIVGRLAIMDALLDLCIAAAILWWFRALEPLDDDALAVGKRSTAFLCGTVALAFGTLAKGPVAPLIVVLVVGVWLIWERRSGGRIAVPRPATLAGAVVLFAAIVLPWFVAVSLRVGARAAVELIGHYSFGRYTGVIENQRGPWWYYVPVLILGFFPWIAFVPVGLVRVVDVARGRSGHLARLAIVWTVLPLLFFSFAQTKLPNYVALLLPALAVVVALWFEQLAEGRDRMAGVISAAAVPLFIGAVAFALEAFVRTNRLDVDSDALAPQLDAIALGMLAGSLATMVAAASPRWIGRAPYVLGATSGALVLFIAFVAVPAAERLKPIPHFARVIDRNASTDATIAIRGVAGGNALVFYTRPGVRAVDDDRAAFVSLICPRGEVFLVTRASDAPELTRIAATLQRRARTLDLQKRDALLQVDGPSCAGELSSTAGRTRRRAASPR